MFLCVKTFFSTFLLLSAISLAHEQETQNNNGGGITLDLIHRDSPASPFYDPTETRFDRQRNAFHRSIARSLHLGLSTNTSSSKLSPPESPITPFSGEYLTKFRIGTPPVEVLAVVDTHSDLTWTQCAPCNASGCYPQKTPLFDPRKSKTYRQVTCGSDQCALLDKEPLRACDKDPDPCTYYTFFLRGDPNIRSGGDIALETFTLGQNSAFPEVVFGCGHDNRGDFIEKGSGVLGLARGPPSIVNQLSKSIGGAKFSYCLTSPDSNVSGKINLGAKAVVKGPKVVSTPMRDGDTGYLYTVSLEGISVGNQRLEFNSIPISSASVKRSGNMIIDSSIAMTVLSNSTLYDELESALVKIIKDKRVPDPTKANGLCYGKNIGGGFSSPAVTLHFSGADLVLSEESTFVEVEEGVVCLSFVRYAGTRRSDSIFGSIQQRNYLIGFDVDNKKVDFLPTDCTNPTVLPTS